MQSTLAHKRQNECNNVGSVDAVTRRVKSSIPNENENELTHSGKPQNDNEGI